ncbi:MAG: hypothetical protein B7X43_04525 [Thiomonas sp. 15-63-373]|nr:MAG: hypothetical protein B7X43_04525 [Thiomonas sp. 15-63-373]
MSTLRLASCSDSAPSKLPQGSLEPRASSPSGGLTRMRQVWGCSHLEILGSSRQTPLAATG